MFKITRKAALLTFLVGALMLSACGGAGEDATPTTDPNIIFTQAAITVQAQLTEMSALTPSATSTTGCHQHARVHTHRLQRPSPPSLPWLPLLRERLREAQRPDPAGINASMYPRNMRMAPLSMPDSSLICTGPSRTPGQPPGPRFTPTASIPGMTSVINRAYAFTKSVAPNNTIDVTVDMTAPSKSDSYMENWVLTNAEGRNFCNFYFEMRVGGTATPGPTKTAVPGSNTATPGAGSEMSYDIDADSTCDDIEIYFNASMDEILDYNNIDITDGTYCDDLSGLRRRYFVLS